MSCFAPADKKLFFSKNDPHDLRLGDVVISQSNMTAAINQLVIIGYPDDRGIQANGGQVGAKEGPKGIRQILYKLVAPVSFKNKICDVGDFACPTELAQDQFIVIQALDKLNSNGNKILSLGGGHDWAFCDVSSFIDRELTLNRRPLVINIDAHLDVRSDKNGVNSGTPFFKVLEKYQKQFDLVQIGIQPHCNSQMHLQYAKDKSVHVVMKDDVESKGIILIMNEIIKRHHWQPVFLSLDIDAITAGEAPGCSQSWPGGLTFNTVRYILTQLNRFIAWNHLGIYEVAPNLDVQNLTQKCAALAAYEFISRTLESQGA